MKTTVITYLFILCVSLPSAICQDGLEIDPNELPRIPATEPDEAIATFEIKSGFVLKLAAHEPDVVDPIGMAFDEDGGLYVIEMRGYSEHREDALGRVRYLTDKDGDGVFDRSTIYKDGLKWPTAITCYKGGVFVGATPDVYYFKDTDGDGVCDEEKTVFTGFGGGNLKLNMQALFNSFRWGPDNRIWGSTASNGGTVSKPGYPDFDEVPLRGSDHSFDPEKLDLRAENGTAQYGLTFDQKGRRYLSSNSKHAIWVAWERRDLLANPWYTPPAPLTVFADDGAAAPVFRISPDEPWRIVRTRWRASGVVKGAVEGGGRVSGYFTAATGIHSYWGDAFSEKYENSFFVGDAGSNLVHRKQMTLAEGTTQPVAQRPTDEGETEFLRSRDNWFRPASFSTGPDGCLYICDVYREVIEHPWSIPEAIKKHIDLDSGNDRGRIYRVEPEDFQRKPIPQLSKATDEELEALLDHPNDWHQTTARRLLFERGKAAPSKPRPAPFPAALASSDSLIDELSAWKGDPWKEAVILNSLRDEKALLDAWQQAEEDLGGTFAVELAKISGRSGKAQVIQKAVAYLSGIDLSTDTVAIITALKAGTDYAKGDWKTIANQAEFTSLFKKAESLATDSDAKLGSRLVAVQLLTFQGNSANLQTIAADSSAHASLVVGAVKGITDPAFLVKHFTNFPREAQSAASAKLIRSQSTAEPFLKAIGAEEIPFDLVPADIVQQLRDHKDAAVKELAGEVFPKMESREEVVARYQSALKSKGDPDKGRAAFLKACFTCHRTHDGQGFVLGPPIATFKTAGADSILGNVLDPNKEVAPQYQAFNFTLHSGESFLGLIENEDATNVTLRLPGGLEKSFARKDVQSMKGIGKSLMPEGLEAALTVEEMADLLAYLMQ